MNLNMFLIFFGNNYLIGYSVFFLLFSRVFYLKCYKNDKIHFKKTKTPRRIFIILSTIMFYVMICLKDVFQKTIYYNKTHSMSKELSIAIKYLDLNTIYGFVSFGCEKENLDQGRSYLNVNIDVSYCFFSRSLLFSGSGGVICVNENTLSMSISFSMFYNTYCSSQGGAIYFISSASYLRMLCANRCTAGSSYHFAVIKASMENQMIYSSVSCCSHSLAGYYSLALSKGNEIFDNTNSSLNSAYQASSLYISSQTSFTSSFCTFSNNKVHMSICIFFTTSTGDFSYSNIVHNDSPMEPGVVYVRDSASLKMKFNVFDNNQNTLFMVRSGSLEVSHSFISHNAQFSSKTSVSTSNNNSFSKKATYQILFFQSYYCNADVGSIPSETKLSFRINVLRSYELFWEIGILMLT